MLESVKYPNQHLTVTKRCTMGDPRTHQIDNSKLFYAYCKVPIIQSLLLLPVALSSKFMSMSMVLAIINYKPFRKSGHVLQGMFRDQGTIMFYTSLIQVMNVDGDNGLIATGKKNRLAFFKVHKVGEGGSVRMFESVVHPRHFIRLKETHVDILVSIVLVPILQT